MGWVVSFCNGRAKKKKKNKKKKKKKKKKKRKKERIKEERKRDWRCWAPLKLLDGAKKRFTLSVLQRSMSDNMSASRLGTQRHERSTRAGPSLSTLREENKTPTVWRSHLGNTQPLFGRMSFEG
jgi:hypothetical protein